MLEQNNNYGEMNQGIDRITEILRRQATPVASSPIQPQGSQLPVNILNALASASYDYGQGGGDFMGNVDKYQTGMQNRELNQQKGLLEAYDMKLKMGDAQAKALDSKLQLFTGNDPEGRALFLQALQDDPEPIDPSNSYQVMTKLAGIKKRLGYESPDLQMAKQKDQLDIDYKRAQINSLNALSAQRSAGGSGGGGGAGAGKPLPISASKAVLENRAGLDVAKRALAMVEGKTIIDSSGNKFVGNANATGLKGYIPDKILQRADPSGVSTRASVADVGSLKIHDRSGAVVTAAEYPRLEPFVPKANDEPVVAAEKLKRFVSEYQALVDENEIFYSESGYNVPENRDRFSVMESEVEAPTTPVPEGVDPAAWKVMTPEERALFE